MIEPFLLCLVLNIIDWAFLCSVVELDTPGAEQRGADSGWVLMSWSWESFRGKIYMKKVENIDLLSERKFSYFLLLREKKICNDLPNY